MTRRYALLLPSVVIVIWRILALQSYGQDGDIGIILKQFPGYHLLTLQERNSDLEAFLARHSPKGNPSIVRADFNGDSNPDYALLLKNDKTEEAKLVVLLCSAEIVCKSVYEVDETTFASVAYLRTAGAGSKVSPTETISKNASKVNLHYTGIQVNYYEKGKVVLHWNAKRQKVEEVQTSD